MTAKDNRLFVEAVLYRYRAGIPWRDLPERFGPDWKVVRTRHLRWAESGVRERVGQFSVRYAMTGSDVRQMDNDKIQAEIARLSGKLYDLRSQTVTEKVEDVSQFGKVRKDIARLLTERTSRIKAGKWAVGSKK